MAKPWHLLGWYRAADCGIGKGECCFEAPLPNWGCPVPSLIGRRVERTQSLRQIGRSLHKRLPKCEKSVGSYRQTVVAPALPIELPLDRLEKMLPDRLQTPTRDCSLHFRFRAPLPAFPAIAQLLLLHVPVG